MAQANAPAARGSRNRRAAASITYDTHPDRYAHWKLAFDGPVATLTLDVDEDRGLNPGYKLKLNSYDLGVDIELADALQRIRFEHPEVRSVVVTSGKERVFCSGANIFMLGTSSHAWKVNFCKFTNETRNGIEDASRHSGLKFIAACNGTTAGGGYELALACDEICLIDDRSSAVSLPEVPLLGVLPGTGGLTRLTDKRRVRRDHADIFCTLVEGVRARARAAVAPDRRPCEAAAVRAEGEGARAGAGRDERPAGRREGRRAHAAGAHRRRRRLPLRARRRRGSTAAARSATITVSAPDAPPAEGLDPILAAGAAWWPLAMARELDDAILLLRTNELDIGTWILKTAGDAAHVLAADATLLRHRSHWFVRETIGMLRRTLARLDVTSRTLFALIEPGSCFAGTLLELALAADRSYMLALPDDEAAAPKITLSTLNFGAYPMVNGHARLAARFYGEGGADRAREGRRRPRAGRGRRARARPRHRRAGRARLGRRGARRAGGAREPVAGRADRHGSQSALRRPRDDGDADLRPALRLAELDLHPAERGRRGRRAEGLRHRQQAPLQLGPRLTRPPDPTPHEERTMSIDYSEKIPNNVNLAGNKTLQRALEHWQPEFLNWWGDMGPENTTHGGGLPAHGGERRAQGLGALRPREDARLPLGHLPRAGRGRPHGHFGAHKGEPAWQEVPGEYRANLRRLIVTQGDTEPASVEQQRHLGLTCPSLYDLRNLFQVNVEEGRHLWAMVYLLHAHFGRDGREEAEALLERRSGDADNPRILGAFNEPTPDWLSFFMFTFFTDRDGKYQLCSLAESGFDPLARTCRFMLTEEAHHMFVGESGVGRIIQRTCETMAAHRTEDPARAARAGRHRPADDPALPQFPFQRDDGSLRLRRVVERRDVLHDRPQGPLRRDPDRR